jgi:hypothetical protein
MTSQTETTSPTTLTCEADTSGRYATRPRACGAPATMGFRTLAYDRSERLEARCARHAGALKRSRYPGGELIELGPEVVDAISSRVAEAKARREVERAVKREQDAIRMEAARVESHAADAVAWSAVRADEQALDGWDGAAPTYRTVPRWAVRPAGVERSWDDLEVKVGTRDGWPASIELRAGSRLTRRQAVALAEALLAAADEA